VSANTKTIKTKYISHDVIRNSKQHVMRSRGKKSMLFGARDEEENEKSEK
jgi:hypothetical protein